MHNINGVKRLHTGEVQGSIPCASTIKLRKINNLDEGVALVPPSREHRTSGDDNRNILRLTATFETVMSYTP